MSKKSEECNPELVSAFLDDELDRIILGRVTRHLVHCDDCCRTMGRLAQIRDAFAGRFVLCEPEEMVQSVMMAIRNEKSTSPRERLRDRLLRFGIPAIVVGTILATALPAALDAREHDGEHTEIRQ